MPAKIKVILRSNFKAAISAGHLATSELIREATDKMHDTAEQRLEQGAGRRGYNLPRDIKKEVHPLTGKIIYDHFYGRWFEYGTVHIPAMPFMRPGNRAGRKVIKERGTAEAIFEKWMRRRAQVRR